MKVSIAFLAALLSTSEAFTVPSKSTIGYGSRTKISMVASPVNDEFQLGSYLKEKKVAVEKALDESIVADGPQVEKICDSMRYSLLAGGKRIRPILCIAACEMFGGSAEAAMPTAVALEMIHTMSLIHDDLPSMDNDDLRRGVPTNHVVYGEDIAILAGDAMLSTSFEHVAKYTPKSVPAERTLEVIGRLGKSVGAWGLAGGQAMDLLCEGKSGVTTEDLTWIHMHKTAALLKVAVASGAILGGASKEDVDLVEKFAEDIGLAFQVADDILDCTQTSEELGKTAGKDEAVDKTTYVKLLGMDGARAEAKRLTEEAKSCLTKFGDDAIPLLAIADFIIERTNIKKKRMIHPSQFDLLMYKKDKKNASESLFDKGLAVAWWRDDEASP
eukprot:CAMPEP_0194722352 /NCGR_PEP_ID=MMETSP0296-20130528/13479_1 /TAXON_ID=39354 /ORGANISM="Heterosigma akashiwo, Strain CCMP2393" /LENGTH=385 /DNA_ID=CAMNT_0039625305 /DNA_START=57 /DNA_END=1214 /DNA_ORIENTATION=-